MKGTIQSQDCDQSDFESKNILSDTHNPLSILFPDLIEMNKTEIIAYFETLNQFNLSNCYYLEKMTKERIIKEDNGYHLIIPNNVGTVNCRIMNGKCISAYFFPHNDYE